MTMSASSSGSPDMSPALSESDRTSTRALLESLYAFGKDPTKEAEDNAKLSKLLRHTDHAVGAAPDGKEAPGSEGTTDAEAEDRYTITSWKMQDYAYKRDPCPYPTRARGLFTVGTERIVARAYDKFFNVDEVTWTKWDNLPDLTTAPYYLTLKANGCLILVAALSPTELLITSKHAIGQAKEAGSVSHAEVGERWLDRGLAKIGKTREQLAERLWMENWTCVAELCDDSFEEHILPYPADKSGLHLHGLVVNHPTLLTLPPAAVNKVAAEYGFVETPFVVLNSVAEVRTFADDVARTGMWRGEYVEGFVVRAALKPGSLAQQPSPNDLTEDNWQDESRVFMWKIKFDQPYLMWREWRELTKKILSSRKKDGDDVAQKGKERRTALNGGPSSANDQKKGTQAPPEQAMKRLALGRTDVSNGLSTQTQETASRSTGNKGKGRATIAEGQDDADLQKSAEDDEVARALPPTIQIDKIRNPESRLYAVWVGNYMTSHPEEFVEYQDNRGIISVRDAFLGWKETEDGLATAERVLGTGKGKGKTGLKEGRESQPAEGPFEKTLIVPIAVPGCGKTMIGVALSHLFGFAHTQSDDVKAKKAAKHFEAEVAKLLAKNDVVFADKNNHLEQHRAALVDIARKAAVRTRIVVVHWPLTTLPHNEIHRICSDRIVARGENHQTLRPVATGEHEGILSRFFSQNEVFDPVFNSKSDAQVDDIIEVDIAWSLEQALHHIVDKLVEIGDVKGVRQPTPEAMQEAIAKTKGYKTSIVKEMKLEGLDSSSKHGGKSKGARYYGIAVEVDLDSLLGDAFGPPAEAPKLLQQLRSKSRIESKPHVTLVHENMLELAEDGSNATSVEAATTLWEKCKKAAQRFGDDVVDVTLTLGPLVVWDSRAMSIQVSKVEYGGANVDPADLPSDVHKHSYHITVGTLEQDIRPIEGKWLLESALKSEETSRAGGKIERADIAEVEVRGRIRGLF